MSALDSQSTSPMYSCRFWTVLIVVLLGSGQAMFTFFDRKYQRRVEEHCTSLHYGRSPIPHHSKNSNTTNITSKLRPQGGHDDPVYKFSKQSEDSKSDPQDAPEANETAAMTAITECQNPTSPPSPAKQHFYKSRTVSLNEFDGVKARSFSSWPKSHPLPCSPLEDKWDHMDTLQRPTNDGLLFLKPYKTGSSTAVGVHLRVSRNIAHRRNRTLCKMRFDHSLASEIFPSRNKEKSFLWTIVRDPTSRIVSFFFHFIVSRSKKEPSFASFKEMFHEHDLQNYYAHAFSPQRWTDKVDPVKIANGILGYYDFVAVTERMDESVVVLSMLMNIPVADVLYLKSKGHGGYDDGGGRESRICTYIWPSFVTDTMEEFFKTEEYQDMIRWDRAIHQAANRSLDLTIDRLGRPLFEKKFALYQKAKAEAHERCLPETTFPCTKDGEFHKTTDCMWTDSSCNNKCLDRVATDVGLW